MRQLAIVILAALSVAGCKIKVNGSGSVKFSGASYSLDRTINGKRTLTRSQDGVTRTMETPSDVEFSGGQVTKFPPGTVVKVQESKSGVERRAELRDNGGQLELWVNVQGNFRRAAPEDEAWLRNFLSEIQTK